MSDRSREQVDLQVPSGGASVFPDASHWQVGNLSVINNAVNAGLDLSTLLNPILDASHTRDRRTCPPNSACLPGTRKGVLRKIRSWMDSSVLFSNPHCMWVYGYAGCGKSAIAQEIAQYYSRKGRLAASFFFFRGSGDRSRASRFARTVANQMAGVISPTAPLIRAAITANPGLAATASLSAQFEHLVYQPLNAIKWDRMAEALRRGPFLIVLDGLDECEDSEDIADFIQHMLEFFDNNPRTPLRVLIASRVEGHIHQQLHSSKQVRLLNLVDHTSNADISAALDVAVTEAERSRVLAACGANWLTPENKWKLIEHIGGSFIFLNTIIRFLFNVHSMDGLTPLERLPLALNMNPGFDGLYESILQAPQGFPHFLDIISSVALAQTPLSIAQISDLLDIKAPHVVNVLVRLHAIIQVPGDDHTPITLWHTSLRDFLTSETRSGMFYAQPTHHTRIALRCIDLTISGGLGSAGRSPAMLYAQRYLQDHSREFFFRNETGGGDLRSSLNYTQGMDLEGVRDALYKAILEISQEIPYLLETVGVLALTQEPVTVAQMADLLDIKVACVLDVLESLRAIIHFPKDPHKSLIIPRHSSLCDFLLSKTRSGSFFADPTLHGRLVSRCIDLLLHSSPPLSHPAWLYAKKYTCIEPNIQPFEALLLSNAPDYIFDSLYTSVFREASNNFMDKVYKLALENSQEVPHSSEVVTTIALVREPVTVAQMADLLDIEVSCVLDVLKNIRAIVRNPKDLHNSPITPRHSSLCKSLLSESRSGSFFAHPALHARLALRCMNLALCPTTVGGTPASIYAKQHVRDHIKEILARSLEEHGSKEMLIQVRHVLQACSLWPCASALVYHNWCVYYVVLDPSYTLGLPEPFAFVAIENPIPLDPSISPKPQKFLNTMSIA